MVRYLLILSCPVGGCVKQDKILAWQCLHDGHAIYIDEHGYLSCERYSHVAQIQNWKFDCGERQEPHKQQKHRATDFVNFSRAIIQGQPYLAKEAGTLWMKRLILSLEFQFGMSTPESPRRSKSPGRLRARAAVRKVQSPRKGFAGQHLFYVTCPLSICQGRNRLYHWECMEDQSPLYIDEDGWLTCETYNHRARLSEWTFDCGDRRGSHGYRKFVECDFEGIKESLAQGIPHFDCPEEWIWPVIDNIAEQFGLSFVEEKFDARFRRQSEVENLLAAVLKGECIPSRTCVDTGVQVDLALHQREEKMKALEKFKEKRDKEKENPTKRGKAKNTTVTNKQPDNNAKVEAGTKKPQDNAKVEASIRKPQDNAKVEASTKKPPDNTRTEAKEGKDSGKNVDLVVKTRSAATDAVRLEEKIYRYLNRPYRKMVKENPADRESVSGATRNIGLTDDGNRLRQMFVIIQKGIAKNWKSVLRSLPWPAHFDDGRLELEFGIIATKHPSDAREQAYQGLLLWRNSYPRASEQKLLTALRNCELDSIVDEILRMNRENTGQNTKLPSNRTPSKVFTLM
ncbi:uncharacterized protein LOC144434257 [Glandiceps talaboti]